jgi:NADH:ubiquinone oxidoreductase subunit 6 (subunit J)
MASSSLLLLAGAEFVGAAGLMLLGAVTTAYLRMVRSVRFVAADRLDEEAHEPLLACVCGGLLAVALLGGIQTSLASAPFDRSGLRNTAALTPPAVIARSLEQLPPRQRMDGAQAAVAALGETLFGDHQLVVILCGILLMVTAVGASLIVRLDATGLQGDVEFQRPGIEEPGGSRQ